MLKKAKKYMFIIACMLFGMFLFNNVDVLANDAVLLDSSSVFVGEENKDNKYYFSNSATWEFRVDGYEAWNPLIADTFLKWRVVRPDGMATKWSNNDYYIDRNGKFIIENYTNLSYTEELGVADRNSVAQLSTYYVDIQYYSQFIWSTHLKDKDETVKIVVGGTDENLYRPTISIVHDKAASTFKVSAEMLKDGVGTGIITKLSYFFSDVKLDDVKNSQFVHASSIQANTQVTSNIAMEDGMDYLYVLVESGNGYSTIQEFEIPTDNDENSTTGTGSSTSDKSTGLFDYEFGEIILIVLIIVLIVSCALIITQKIVDYKKRLY